MRWDIQTPITDPHDRFDIRAGRAIQDRASAPVGLLFPGDPGVARGIISTNFKHFSPRIGFAWDPVRRPQDCHPRRGGNLLRQHVRQRVEQLLRQPAVRHPAAVQRRLTRSPIPTNCSRAALGPSLQLLRPRRRASSPPSAIVGIGLDYKSPYTYQMNFAIQRQVTRTTSFTVAYVGNLTHRIPAIQDVNYPILTPTATTANVNDAAALPAGCAFQHRRHQVDPEFGLSRAADHRRSSFGEPLHAQRILHIRQGPGRGQHAEQHPAAGDRLEQHRARSRARKQRPHAQRRDLGRLGPELFQGTPLLFADRQRLVARGDHQLPQRHAADDHVGQR